jgi:hypothetical protein
LIAWAESKYLHVFNDLQKMRTILVTVPDAPTAAPAKGFTAPITDR